MLRLFLPFGWRLMAAWFSQLEAALDGPPGAAPPGLMAGGGGVMGGIGTDPAAVNALLHGRPLTLSRPFLDIFTAFY